MLRLKLQELPQLKVRLTQKQLTDITGCSEGPQRCHFCTSLILLLDEGEDGFYVFDTNVGRQNFVNWREAPHRLGDFGIKV
jgi:hypothetical protein